MIHRILTLLITAFIVAAIGACNGRKDAGNEAAVRPAGAADTTQLAPPLAAPPVDTTHHETDTMLVVSNTAVISTSMGDITVDLFGKDAPKTVANFVGLASKHYFDGMAFHRVIAGFVIQVGDPQSRDTTLRGQWGSGGESIYGKEFEDELNPESPSGRLGYREGVLAMANHGPNTNGSQFFIVLSDKVASTLPYSYTIFGRVKKGLDVVHKIERTGDTGEMPLHPAIIKSVTVKEAAM
jgi:peptidylprolyl isomerase domain and WD repeat-containing protein 1